MIVAALAHLLSHLPASCILGFEVSFWQSKGLNNIDQLSDRAGLPYQEPPLFLCQSEYRGKWGGGPYCMQAWAMPETPGLAMEGSCRHELHQDRMLGHPVCCPFAVWEELFSQ